MKKYIFLLLVVLLFSTCAEEKNCCTVIDIGVAVKYVNENGENLLKLNNGGLDVSKITLYSKINNEWVKFIKGSTNAPKGVAIIEREGVKYLNIYTSTEIVENKYSETKIEFSKTDFDIIKTELNTVGSNIIVTKVWYNNKLKWDTNNGARKFEVVK